MDHTCDPAAATGVCVTCGADLLGYYDDLPNESRLLILNGLRAEGYLP